MRLIITLIFSLSVFASQAQKITISGVITDKETGERLIGAAVYDKKTGNGVATNNNGFYNLSINRGDTAKIIISYVGYGYLQKKIIVLNDTTLNFSLIQNNQLDEVIVNAEQSKQQRPEVSIVNIPMAQAKKLPVMTGETDIIKVYQLMPGIQPSTEGASTLIVRGGSADQNLYLLDDVPIYYTNHFGGFFSIFDENAINKIDVYKGGFPARYNGRLSSIIDIRMKEGNAKKITGEAKIGVIATKLFVEGPIVNDKTRFMVSVRRSNLDLYTRLLSVSSSFKTGIGFYDINAKISHRMSAHDNISLSFYNGRDKVFFKQKPESSGSSFGVFSDDGFTYQMDYSNRWGNLMSSLRWNHIYNSRLSSNVTFAYTNYFYNTEFDFKQTAESDSIHTETAQLDYDSGMKDLIARAEFDYYTSIGHNIKFGIGANAHWFNPGVTIYKEKITSIPVDTTYGCEKTATSDYVFFIEDNFNILKTINANIGFCATAYNNGTKTFTKIQPRAVLNFRLHEKLSVKAGYSAMVQNIHLLSNAGSGVPTDLWVPPTNKVKPQISNQYVVGLNYANNKNIEFITEAYYKTMSNLIEFKDGASFENDDSDWQNNIETNGKGRVKGIEFMLRRSEGRLSGWISYAISKSERQFDNINNGKYYLYKFDRKHDVDIVANYQLTKNISLSATWIYTSGNMMTMPTAKYNIGYISSEYKNESELYSYTTNTAYFYGEKNNVRIPATHRLDISASFTKQKKHGTRTWQVSIYNVYNRKNIYFLYYSDGGNQLNSFSLLPIIPSFSYSYRF